MSILTFFFNFIQVFFSAFKDWLLLITVIFIVTAVIKFIFKWV